MVLVAQTESKCSRDIGQRVGQRAAKPISKSSAGVRGRQRWGGARIGWRTRAAGECLGDCRTEQNCVGVCYSTAVPRPRPQNDYPSDSLTHRCSTHQQDSIQRPYFLNWSILAASPCKHRHTQETPCTRVKAPRECEVAAGQPYLACDQGVIGEGAWASTRTKPR